jgi:hypothetical protein
MSSKKAKYSSPTKRVSSYPQRSKARVTFEDENPSERKKFLVKRRCSARHSELYSEKDQLAVDADSSLVVESMVERSSRDYKCGVCGQSKKGHKCQGEPSSWEVPPSSGRPTKKNDIILSLTDANYKSIMFSYFRKLGDMTDEEEETKVIDEAFNFFKISGDRFVRYQDWRHPALGFIPVDDKKARQSKYHSIEMFVWCRKFPT